MKKFILLLVALVAFNGHAALIEITLDDNNYQLNDTVNGQIIVTDFNDLLGGFSTELNYNPSALQLLDWQLGDGFDDGFGSYQYSEHDASLGRLVLDDYADFFADTSILSSNQGNEFVLASFSFSALSVGSQVLGLNALNSELINFDNDFVAARFNGVSFNVNGATAVPTPASIILMVIGLVLMGTRRFS